MSRVLVYRRKPSQSAVALADALREHGIDAKKVRSLRRARDDDTIVCWGEQASGAINGSPLRNKLEELQTLQYHGVPTVEYTACGEFTDGTWVPRSRFHTQGRDLSALPGEIVADYWVKKEKIIREARVHVWQGASIRAGVKRPVPGETPHDWIRSRGCGWRIEYTGVNEREREIAKRAVAALGLDFGAVDVATTVEDRVIVLECNRAPGLEGNTVEAYARAIGGI